MNPKDNRPLVTVLGATGFIGSAVLAALARRPIRLRAVGRTPSAFAGPSVAELDVRTAELTDRAQLAEAVAGSDVVIHLVLCAGGWRAADADPDGSERVNVGIMRDLLDVLGTHAPGPAPLVVYSGAASQIGVPPDRPVDGSEPDNPETRYDRQKLAAEDALAAATRRGTVRGITLRLPTVFGLSDTSGADNGVVSLMVRRALAGEPITMWHDGTVRRDVVYVDDIAAAFVAAIDHAGVLTGQRWLVGSGRSPELGEVFDTISRAVSEHSGAPPVPVTSVPPPADAPVTDLRSLVIDSARFRTATGWYPKVPVRDAVDRTIAELTRQHVPSRP